MSRFKFVFMDFDAEAVPDWVPTALAEAGIDFAAHKCRTSAELAEYARDADVVTSTAASSRA